MVMPTRNGTFLKKRLREKHAQMYISLCMSFSNALDEFPVYLSQSGPTSFMVEWREKVLPTAT